MAKLGVNIDHVATVREARKTYEPDPVWAAVLAELGGADGVTLHLREDRRHIQDRDLRVLRETVHVPLNLELACVDEMVSLACEILPEQVTLVPERREEVTTEGGLEVVTSQRQIGDVIGRLHEHNLIVSLFLDPDAAQIEAASDAAADAVELHTGKYANARGPAVAAELMRLANAAAEIRGRGLTLHAGHGLNYHNVQPVAQLKDMCELNIGHSIVARSIMVGMQQAVQEMKALIE